MHNPKKCAKIWGIRIKIGRKRYNIMKQMFRKNEEFCLEELLGAVLV